MNNSTNFSVDDGDGHNLCGGLTRDDAHVKAQQHANKTGLACLVYGGDYEKCVEPDDHVYSPADDAAVDSLDAIAACLDADQRDRRALGALPAAELRFALGTAIIASVQARLGDAFVVDMLDDAPSHHWGELPRGGGEIVRRLNLVGDDENEWRPIGGCRLSGFGNASELATGPVVVVSAIAAVGFDASLEYFLGVSRT
jgi:hypothetical protein